MGWDRTGRAIEGQQLCCGSLGLRSLFTGGGSLPPGSCFSFAVALSGFYVLLERAMVVCKEQHLKWQWSKWKGVAAAATVILRAAQMDLNNGVKLKSEDIYTSLPSLPFASPPQARVIWAFVLIHQLIWLFAWEFSLQKIEVTLSQLSDSLWYKAVWKAEDGDISSLQGPGFGYLVSFKDWDLGICFLGFFFNFFLQSVYRGLKQKRTSEIHTVPSNSMLNCDPHSCDKQGKSIQLILAICIKCVDADKLFLWDLLWWLLCRRDGRNFSPKTPFGYFQGDQAVPFFLQNDF